MHGTNNIKILRLKFYKKVSSFSQRINLISAAQKPRHFILLVTCMSWEHQMKHINRLYLQGVGVLNVRTDGTVEV